MRLDIKHEDVATREQAKSSFILSLKQAVSEEEVKITCRVFTNLIGPAAMGPVWLIDTKPVTKFMWTAHSKLQMAFVYGLISFLPELKQKGN